MIQQPVHKAPRLYHCESNTHARGRVPRPPLPATLVRRGIGRLYRLRARSDRLGSKSGVGFQYNRQRPYVAKLPELLGPHS
jgi:hypothetical protein